MAINRFSRSTRYDIRIGESNFNGINRLEPTTRTNISSQKQSQWREVISGIVNVGSNLICTGDGLIVNESNTVVNTNGHSIVGPGTGSSKVGFMIPNTYDVTIQGPGTVSHFQAGLLITRSNNVKVKSLILEGNEIGIFSTGSDGAQVQKNIIDSNNIGFASHSSDGVKVDTNIMTNNP